MWSLHVCRRHTGSLDQVCHACQVVPGEEAGTEASEDVAMPRNNTERDVQLNLAVALRMVEERG